MVKSCRGFGQGSTRALTNSTTGAVTDTYSYTAFGEIFNRTGTTINPYQYTGQQFDSFTGLYSLRARYYNSALGRFLSQDTYSYNTSNPVELNRYVYVANSPINLTDPTGHDSAEYAMPLSIFPTLGRAAGPIALFIYGTFALTASLWLLAHYFQLPKEGTIPGVEEWTTQSGNGSGSSGGGFNWGNVIITAVSILTLASILVNPNVYQDTVEQDVEQTDTDESEKPIVLDLGPSVNVSGEILPLIAYYKPQGVKVVAIEEKLDAMSALEALEASMPDDFSVIQGSFTDSNILSENGYTCAQAAFSLWPGFDYGNETEGYKGVPIAINNLVCPGGYVHVITEVETRFNFIANTAAVNWEFKSPPMVSGACVNNPLSAGCSPYSNFSIPVGFNSEHTGSKNYVLIGQK